MKSAITSILLIIYTLAGSFACIAQPTGPSKNDSSTFDFVPGIKVIFEDNFSQDSIGKFPSKWRLYPTIPKLEIDDSITNTGVYPITVQKPDSEDDKMLTIASDNHYFPLKPKLYNKNYLKDTFTIEFDFRMDNEQSDPAIVLFDENGNNIFECRIIGSGEIISKLMNQRRFSIDYPVLPFVCQKWHHFALSCMHRQIKCYIDQYRLVVVPDCGNEPGNFIIAGNSYTEGNPTVSFKKFRFATDITPYQFNKIRTENKFTTHAIHFQKGQSAIEPESMDFIKRLADWLKANPDIQMEIDGYTDNDGDPKTNIKLSQERASAVKDALEILGIDSWRLTTNGFGEGNPIDTNATPEGKAQNRRVEFIKK
jgi:outer membrane protein OmpA-like peptidoglycan-associated protein